MSQSKAKSFEETSILAWKQEAESYAQAKARLAVLWKQGQHPLQLQRERKRAYEE